MAAMAEPVDIAEIAPRDAWALLERDPKAVLVDVRTEPEWGYVGLPDLGSLGKPVLRLSWQVYPTMAVDPGFADGLAAAGITPDHSLLFLCRSGVRSLAAAKLMVERGFPRCYNITGGFEGPPDATRHRGTVAGWKHDGLPWTQG
jgi:rhodanese-related sulfurtransferase